MTKNKLSFFVAVVGHGLAMMIPLILVGGIASAILHLPINAYQEWLQDSLLYTFLKIIYNSTFGIFSIVMLIALSSSYCMERNMPIDRTAVYILVSLCAFGTQSFTPSGGISLEMLGVKGCFFAIVTAFLSSILTEKLHHIPHLQFKRYTFGMSRISALSISLFHSALLVIAIFAIISQSILSITDADSMYSLLSGFFCSLFDNIDSEFGKGLTYTCLLHILWSLGIHGSHVLEPIATTSFALGSAGDIFSKDFFDIYVVMGGCGTTICTWLSLLVFFNKSRLKELTRLASFTVIFNLNEIITFGIPIVLNPILIIPFIITPIVCYILAFGATYIGLVPPVVNSVAWSTPIFFNAYLGTGSAKACVLQLFLIIIGTAIYTPFLKHSIMLQELHAKNQLSDVVKLLNEDEEINSKIDLLYQSNRLGQICRMLRHDLKTAIKNRDVYLVFQPQVDNSGKCIGAEALLRWKHPLYGFIYPPLIIYLAKNDNMLEELEREIIDQTIESIVRVKNECGNHFKISMNLTAKSLMWKVEDYIADTLKKNGVEEKLLWLEITEQDVLSKNSSAFKKIELLKSKGHVMMIDDFGMGHTSILYLQSGDFGVVKLDGSLVKNIENDITNQEIISSISALAKKLDVKMIAEYVEDEAQKQTLERLGCDWYQGFLYSKPLSLEEFIQFMKSH